ncbi:MAG: hypothetical protein P9F75_00355 [Candidatus Contendobacter sp.]|nr:hypothetical protein [Candidatus Contendobacter sp.]
MRDWLRTVLFLSAFSPVLLALAYVRYDMHGFGTEVIQLLVIGILGTMIPPLIVRMVVTSSESIAFEAKKVKPNDFALVMFVASYFVPILVRASSLDMIETVIATVVIISIIWLTSSIPAHPLLRLLKFRFYEVESCSGMIYTLISKREIRDTKDIRFVKKLSSSMLMEANDAI